MNGNTVQRIRFIAGGSVSVFTLTIIVMRFLTFAPSLYSWLWVIPGMFANLLDLYFLNKSLLKRPKNIDTRLSTFCISIGATFGMDLVAAALNAPPLSLPYIDFIRHAGGILALLPYPFILWALLCLKDCLTVIPEAHGVIAHGIYKYSRHPLYVCYITWSLANSMMFPSFLMFAACLANILLLILRLRREENLLLSTFPEYRQYRQQTGLLGIKPLLRSVRPRL
jgi:protein-S-isoprenylcysteine O-methyltransferase Ste14